MSHRQLPVCGRVEREAQLTLARPQRFLGLLALRQVVDDPGEEAAAVESHLADREVEGEDRAVLSPAGHLASEPDDAGLSRLQIPLQIAVVLLGVRRRHQHVDVATDDLVGPVAEEALARGVEQLDRAALVDDDDAVDTRGDDRAHALLAGGRSLEQLLPLDGGALGEHGDPTLAVEQVRHAESGHDERREGDLAGRIDVQRPVRAHEEVGHAEERQDGRHKTR